jgi:mono/diheme cytochrome c family protein
MTHAARSLATHAARLFADKPGFDRFVVGLIATAALFPSLPLRSASGAEPLATAKRPAAPVAPFAERTRPLLAKHCFACHGDKKTEGDINLSRYGDNAAVAADRATWEAVLGAIESGAMPPPNRPRLSDEERQSLVRHLERVLFHLDCDDAMTLDPGRVTIRRLNRVEYNNTVRDLLGIEFRPAEDFPTDDVGHGFDNIGDVLTISPLLIEKYLAAAERIAAAAMASAESPKPFKQSRRGNDLKTSGSARPSLFGIHNIVGPGAVTAEFETGRAGEYRIKIRAASPKAGGPAPRMELHANGAKVAEFTVTATAGQPQFYEHRLKLPAGPQRFAVHYAESKDPTATPPTATPPTGPTPANATPVAPATPAAAPPPLSIGVFELEGPLDAAPSGGTDSPARIRLRLVLPEGGRSSRDAARDTLAPFVRRAFRRTPRPGEVEAFVDLAQRVIDRGANFSKAIEVAIAAVLVSPHFLFRVEREELAESPAKAPSSPGTPSSSSASDTSPARRTLGDFELASRLSYFLWSSMPDERLLRLAEEGQLQREQVLVEEARRLLADPRSRAIAENFASQWLNLRGLDDVAPDPKSFPRFNAALRNDMRRETELLFDTVVRENRSLLELIDADFTFVNQRLAAHYGLPAVKGDQFQRVSLRGTPRAGVLTHASVLTLTSNPTRTSPVKRGKWIMENILGTPPPEPPANVPELSATQAAQPDASLRQALEIHRRDPNCAVCHQQMDTLGFGFENFDAVGRWRDRDGEHAVDAAGVLPDGAKFSGPAELVAILKEKKPEYIKTLSERMLTYALGRGLTPADRCVIDEIRRRVTNDGYRATALVEAIVRSEPFRMRKREEEKP